jgi:4-hydroxy-tetrahydrodipicolinate synthase
MNLPMNLPGLLVPPLTPFTAGLGIDERALERQIDYIVTACNPAMIVAAGVEAQEYHFLSFEERKRLIARTMEFVKGRVPVAVGISHASFKTAIELAHFAEGLGAAAVQLLAPLRPFGGAPSDRDLVAYFEAVARETGLPLVLYLNPGPGADVSVPATIELSKLDRVHYIKESSRDLSRVSRLIVEVDRAGHARYFTTMQMLLATLELGGSGATMPPPAAELAARIVKAFLAGNAKEAARLQLQFALFPAKWMHRGLTPTMKAAMQILGRPVGDIHPPFQCLTAAEIDDLRTYLKSTDLAPAESKAEAAA